VHAADLDIAVIDDYKGCEHLADEFFHRGYDKDVIFEPEEEDDERRGDKILKIRKLTKVRRKQATKNEAGEDTDPAQRRNRYMMYFAGIGHVEELFHFSHVDDGWNSKKGDSKRNSYRK